MWCSVAATRLGVDRKLGFLKKAGIFRSRSIEKLNTLRNRLEHHYEIPKVEDVEVYFDLVSAFVGVVEATIPALGVNSSMGMSIVGGGHVSTRFKYEGPEVQIVLEQKTEPVEQVFCIDLSTSSDVTAALDSFAFLLKIHIFFTRVENGAIGDRHFVAALKGDVRI
ncbi:hypothetical protein WS63_22400 [Burkholderia stagnalis]|nr:hypothetical protein WS63_22400 [Burkholderia stagnalis]